MLWQKHTRVASIFRKLVNLHGLSFRGFKTSVTFAVDYASAGTESAVLIVGHNLVIDVSVPSSPRTPAGLRTILNVLVVA